MSKWVQVLWACFALGLLFGLPKLLYSERNATLHAEEMTLKELHDYARKVTVQVLVRRLGGEVSSGSGVWISEKGYVATALHVVTESEGPIEVRVGIEGWYDFERQNIAYANFQVYTASVVARDRESDIAILKVEKDPFANPPGVFLKTPEREFRAEVAVASPQKKLPTAGELVILSGYPLNRPDLLTQTGNVAGVGFPERVTDLKKLRILLSLISNPANSGGPVLNENGKLIGVLQGNLPSPVKDES